MEPNQIANPSQEASGIPQGIPTGVFVPNNQIPVQASAVSSQIPVAPVSAPETPIQGKEGALDRVFKGLARFFARVMGQPDPITGAPNAASQALQKSQNIVGKVRGAANQVVEKASDVAGKAVNTVNQATQQIQQVIPQQTAAPVPEVSSIPVAPVEPISVVQQPVQPTPTV